MASVRLTKDLKERIIRAVESDFDELLSNYRQDEEACEEVRVHALAMLASANAEYKAVASSAETAIKRVISEHNGALPPESIESMLHPLAASVNSYASFHVEAIDPEAEGNITARIHHESYPFKDVASDKRRILPWSTMNKSGGLVTNDAGLVAKLMPVFLQRRALENSCNLAIQYAKNVMSQCNTLTQLVRKWPDAVNVVPKEYLNRMEDKSPSTPRQQEEPVAIMGMDEALKSIRLQAEAVKALKG